MFGEGVETLAIAEEIRFRRESDDAEHAVDAARSLPALLRSADGRAAVDVRVRVERSGLAAFPASLRDAAEEGGGGEREVWIDGARRRRPVVSPAKGESGKEGAGAALLESPYWSAVVPGGWRWQRAAWGLELRRA